MAEHTKGEEPETDTESADNLSQPTRARTRDEEAESQCTLTEQRVARIARMMAAGKWHGYPTRAKLASEWGITDSRVRQYASEAHRLVAFDPQERDELRRSLAASLKRIASKAERIPNQVTGLPDWKAAIDAIERYAKFAGIELDQTEKPADDGPAQTAAAQDALLRKLDRIASAAGAPGSDPEPGQGGSGSSSP